MPVLGVPNVVVAEPVDVHVQPVSVHVDVRNEEMCGKPPVPPPAKK